MNPPPPCYPAGFPSGGKATHHLTRGSYGRNLLVYALALEYKQETNWPKILLKGATLGNLPFAAHTSLNQLLPSCVIPESYNT